MFQSRAHNSWHNALQKRSRMVAINHFMAGLVVEIDILVQFMLTWLIVYC